MMNMKTYIQIGEQNHLAKDLINNGNMIQEWTKISGIKKEMKKAINIKKNLRNKCGMNLMISFSLTKDLKVQQEIIQKEQTIKQKLK